MAFKNGEIGIPVGRCGERCVPADAELNWILGGPHDDAFGQTGCSEYLGSGFEGDRHRDDPLIGVAAAELLLVTVVRRLRKIRCLAVREFLTLASSLGETKPATK